MDPEGGASKEGGLKGRVKSWIMDSLSGININQKIHESIRRVLGVLRDDGPTDLERALVQAMDQVLRRGKSPSILLERPRVWEAFNVVVHAFPNDQTTIYVRDHKNQEYPEAINVFRSLRQYALDCRRDEQRLASYKESLAKPRNFLVRKRIQSQIADVRKGIAERTALFQKIVFAEADRMGRGGRERMLQVQGKPISLNDWLRQFESKTVKGPALKAPETTSPEVVFPSDTKTAWQMEKPASGPARSVPPPPEASPTFTSEPPSTNFEKEVLPVPETGNLASDEGRQAASRDPVIQPSPERVPPDIEPLLSEAPVLDLDAHAPVRPPEVVSWDEVKDLDEEDDEDPLDKSFKLDF